MLGCSKAGVIGVCLYAALTIGAVLGGLRFGTASALKCLVLGGRKDNSAVLRRKGGRNPWPKGSLRHGVKLSTESMAYQHPHDPFHEHPSLYRSGLRVESMSRLTNCYFFLWLSLGCLFDHLLASALLSLKLDERMTSFFIASPLSDSKRWSTTYYYVE